MGGRLFPSGPCAIGSEGTCGDMDVCHQYFGKEKRVYHDNLSCRGLLPML